MTKESCWYIIVHDIYVDGCMTFLEKIDGIFLVSVELVGRGRTSAAAGTFENFDLSATGLLLPARLALVRCSWA